MKRLHGINIRSIGLLLLASVHLLRGATSTEDRFTLVAEGKAVSVLVAESDWKVAKIAAADLVEDVERVTGVKPALYQDAAKLGSRAVLIGTLGRSPVIDGLVDSGKLEVSDLTGQWESFAISMIKEPLPGVERALVIVGSDRRGTAYGAYELSRRIGVSPWNWWADVNPEKQEELAVSTERIKVGPPAVRYRGIFINDEMWGLRPWAEGTYAPDEGKGIGPKTHARIFELLLRLRANYLWPAMHLHTIPFNTYEANKQVADDYAIVMGSSHIEPMLRNSFPYAEWDREGGGEWNYFTNRDEIYKFWERRIRANGQFENVYTLGMRGQDDEAMEGGHTQQEKIDILEKIFADQREILTRHIDPDPSKIPQVFIPYTEVLYLYDAGMEVPDDVTICWPEDNFGFIRRLPGKEELSRAGGHGIYYHIQWLNGATTAYTWLNTMPPALIMSEMLKAYDYGADRLWVLNVGDIKPGEIGMEFFLDLAWDPEKLRKDGVEKWLRQWAARDLDPRYAGEIADIMLEYYELGFTRRPEHLLQQMGPNPMEFSWFSHEHFGDEASHRLARYAEIEKRAEALYSKMPEHRKAAFFQLVLYPVKACSRMNHKIIHADKSLYHAARGRATAQTHAGMARAAAEAIQEMDHHYNHELTGVGDKWRYMMTSTPGPWGRQRHQFEMPPVSDFAGGGPPALEVAPEGGAAGELADFSIYTQGERFIDLFNLGRGEITWQAKASQPWLTVEPSSGRLVDGQRLAVRVDWEAFSGLSQEAAIIFTSNAGDAVVKVPVFAPDSSDRDRIEGYVESHGYVSMEAEHFTRRVDRGGVGWRVIKDLGRSGDAVTVLPPTVESVTGTEEIISSSPVLEFDMHLFSAGEFELHLDCLPTHPVSPDHGYRLAVSLNGGAPFVPEEKKVSKYVRWRTNLRRWTASIPIDEPGKHTLKIWMVDPGVVLDRITLYTEEAVDSYLGPPESHRN